MDVVLLSKKINKILKTQRISWVTGKDVLLETEDIKQNLFVLIIAENKTFSSDAYLHTWVSSRVLNMARDLSIGNIESHYLSHYEDGGESICVFEDKASLRVLIRDALNDSSVSKGDIDLLISHYVYGETFKEIGDKIGSSKQYVQKRVSMVINKHKEELMEILDDVRTRD